ncbi:N-acetyltransferase (plasmid) [Haloferax mediterranei ATCC 33500]|uniref:GCN5 family acetyltransferase n=1 Tax=Haloferax mediterranei (strain ATCC 33500 / DSM 1411 / JCM 8866 / NBRC 14739 / NCIMB 2177 / R-4) TaxID=523841 RepID=I3RAB2_HALMT|nr:GNAT family N-acetyltransferase [Haloferax mediterranei]AFK21172.1 GCN5-related N-acetyltransferase [Haloferax mediterranei ATCC 33500]AHZ24710.1 GCN5 family acetyltransferase [Haloferax mediterranei ATCC 33500]ELZ97493.1 N-acetyltransferase GCN5 [Haloferax mediterranei ATCC 33500]MDX5990215.1 GNAT family N-acetyltransferase [Haloferax mediterranei ATCC 33500]QCQ76715.1 N-acetyltransferase [Haloferax mediterranei ATCC 33500]
MDIREATTADTDGIREVAHDSLVASYGHALDETLIESSVEEWYGDDELTAELDDDNTLFLVCDDSGDIVAFSQSYLRGKGDVTGQISWLHVHPEHRDRGIGARLLTRTEEGLVDHGAARLTGKVLELNELGADFYEHHGYEEVDSRRIDLGSEQYDERVFEKFLGTEDEVAAPLDPRTVDSRTVYVAFDESDRGSQAPFYVSYVDEERANRYGYFCGNCESFEVSMDSMGRVICNNCGNKRRPSRWDSAYL